MPKQGWIAFIDAHVVVALVLPKGRPRGTRPVSKACVPSSKFSSKGSFRQELMPPGSCAWVG